MELEIKLCILANNYLSNNSIINKKLFIDELNNTNSIITVSYVYNLFKSKNNDELNDLIELLDKKLQSNEKRLLRVI